MKRVNGIWLPDDETERVMVAAGAKYQHSKLVEAMKYVPEDRRRIALDIGAHCGIWTVQLAEFFDHVICFEPLPGHIEIWHQNMADYKVNGKATMFPIALGAETRETRIKAEWGLSGKSHVDDVLDSAIPVPMQRLDDMKFEVIDFIKIDVEGYEPFVCQGGKETILRHKPVMIVEAKPKNAQRYGVADDEVVRLLESWGAKMVKAIVGDYIFVWE